MWGNAVDILPNNANATAAKLATGKREGIEIAKITGKFSP